MDTKRSRVSGRRKPCPIRFRIDRFETRLRSILAGDASRPPGCPGSDDRPLPHEAREAAVTYLIDSLMSKYDDGKPSPHKDTVALSKFLEAEESCYWRNFFFEQETSWIDKTYPGLVRAREQIHLLLGPVVDLDRLSRGFGWGPGASTRLNRLRGDACYKYSGKPEVTPNAYSAGVAAVAANPIWTQIVADSDGPSCVWGSRYTTVPKNYKTNRSIAIEPDLNMYLQKGIGSLLRQKLKSVAIDLDDQGPNQRGARDYSLATIDFSSASDCVSQGLVKYLLPPGWLDFVQLFRSELIVLPDKSLHRLSKVSSMGNGFTFELESLIFWALARAVVPVSEWSRILVYGDDVLLPCAYADHFTDLCRVAGFLPNSKKTHTSGPFRESCGKHYFRGYDVTPFFIRRPVEKLTDLFLVHNNLRRWISQLDPLLSREEWSGLQDLCRELRNLAPAKWRRPRIPDGFGDGAFIGSFAECSPRVHAGGWEYFEVAVIAERHEIVDTEVPGLLVKSMLNLPKRRRLHPLLPSILEPTYRSLPSSGRGYRPSRMVIPWSAFG